MQFLAGQFGVDVLGFALMSNHIHLILRNRPDVVRGWTDDEVAQRWWNLYPQRKDADGQPVEPRESDLSMITGNPERLEVIRRRLSSLSVMVHGPGTDAFSRRKTPTFNIAMPFRIVACP